MKKLFRQERIQENSGASGREAGYRTTKASRTNLICHTSKFIYLQERMEGLRKF